MWQIESVAIFHLPWAWGVSALYISVTVSSKLLHEILLVTWWLQKFCKHFPNGRQFWLPRPSRCLCIFVHFIAQWKLGTEIFPARPLGRLWVSCRMFLGTRDRCIYKSMTTTENTATFIRRLFLAGFHPLLLQIQRCWRIFSWRNSTVSVIALWALLMFVIIYTCNQIWQHADGLVDRTNSIELNLWIQFDWARLKFIPFTLPGCRLHRHVVHPDTCGSRVLYRPLFPGYVTLASQKPTP